MEEECQTKMEQNGAKDSNFISAPKFKSLTAEFDWFSNFSVTAQATIQEEIWILYVGLKNTSSEDLTEMLPDSSIKEPVLVKNVFDWWMSS